jgi:predicted nuclease of predicted toxin-antitoxin system
MKIFVDENIPSLTVKVLRDEGHDVKDIRGTPDEGMPDEEIWQRILNENRLLITTDKGFSKYRNEFHYGILIIRLRKPNQNKIHQSVIRTLTQFNETGWRGTLVVVRDSIQSVWKLPTS